MPTKKTVPEDIKKFLWAHQPERLEIIRDKRLIIQAVLAYGTLSQLNWLRQTYGDKAIAALIRQTPVTAARPAAAKLIKLLFNASYASSSRIPH